MNKLDPRTTRRLVGTLAASAVLAGGTAAGAQAAPARPSDAPAPQVQQWRTTHRSPAVTSRTGTATTYRSTSTTAYRSTATTAYRAASTSSTSTGTSSTSTSTNTSTTSTTGTNSGGSVTYSSTTSISTAGLSANAVKVLEAINANFPQVTSIGGIRSGSDAQDHATGHALDLMIPNYDTAQGKALGDQIAAFLKAHQAELGVHYVIWSQHIWNVQRDAEGWRAMADRGSVTANHYDHVHVSVY